MCVIKSERLKWNSENVHKSHNDHEGHFQFQLPSDIPISSKLIPSEKLVHGHRLGTCFNSQSSIYNNVCIKKEKKNNFEKKKKSKIKKKKKKETHIIFFSSND